MADLKRPQKRRVSTRPAFQDLDDDDDRTSNPTTSRSIKQESSTRYHSGTYEKARNARRRTTVASTSADDFMNYARLLPPDAGSRSPPTSSPPPSATLRNSSTLNRSNVLTTTAAKHATLSSGSPVLGSPTPTPSPWNKSSTAKLAALRTAPTKASSALPSTDGGNNSYRLPTPSLNLPPSAQPPPVAHPRRKPRTLRIDVTRSDSPRLVREYSKLLINPPTQDKPVTSSAAWVPLLRSSSLSPDILSSEYNKPPTFPPLKLVDRLTPLNERVAEEEGHASHDGENAKSGSGCECGDCQVSESRDQSREHEQVESRNHGEQQDQYQPIEEAAATTSPMPRTLYHSAPERPMLSYTASSLPDILELTHHTPLDKALMARVRKVRVTTVEYELGPPPTTVNVSAMSKSYDEAGPGAAALESPRKKHRSL